MSGEGPQRAALSGVVSLGFGVLWVSVTATEVPPIDIALFSSAAFVYGAWLCPFVAFGSALYSGGRAIVAGGALTTLPFALFALWQLRAGYATSFTFVGLLMLSVVAGVATVGGVAGRWVHDTRRAVRRRPPQGGDA